MNPLKMYGFLRWKNYVFGLKLIYMFKIILEIYLFYFIHMFCLHCMCVPRGVQERVLHSLEVELGMVVGHMWVRETESRSSSARALSALNC